MTPSDRDASPRLVQAGEVRLAVEESGSGPPLVFVSGGVMDRDQWDAQLAAFRDDYRCIRFDQRGVGHSDKPGAGYTIAQMAEDTVALIQALQAEGCILFGNSLGGLIALECALRHPDLVRILILCATPAGPQGIPAPPAIQMRLFQIAMLPVDQAAAALLSVLFATDYPQRHPDVLARAIRKRTDPALAAPLLATTGPMQSALTYDPLERMRALPIPTLILHGQADALTPPDNARVLFEHLADAALIIVERAGHAAVLEQAEAVTRAVRGFVAAVEAGDA